jgi:hypothetical protein
MSGAVAAHAAYNGSGTQGLAVTNKIQDQEGDVMSVFWNKNDTTRQLLHGAAFIDIPTSGNGGTSSFGGNQIFTVNNDIDAIGELFLQISADTGTTTGFTLAGSLAAVIKRVEFHVGTQIWHTLEKEDIMALNMSEMPEGVYGAYHRSIYGGYETATGKKNKQAWGADNSISSAAGGVSGVVRIPTISRQVGPTMSKFTNVVENAYLVAAAPHQTVKVKVYLENLDYVRKHVFLTANGTAGIATTPKLELKLFGKHIIMCNEEREQMKSMPQGLPKRIKMSQNVTHTLNNHPTESFTVDLDHFSLLASHLIITVFGTQEHEDNVASNSGATNHRAVTHSMTNALDEVELKLNSSSFSGTIKGSLLTAPATDMLGLYYNTQPYYGAVAGEDDATVQQEHVTGLYRTYVFPLASQAFSGSSVPLNRFDNIRLTILLPKSETPNKTNHTVFGDSTRVSVTCVGETTALYKGGAASLAMY